MHNNFRFLFRVKCGVLCKEDCFKRRSWGQKKWWEPTVESLTNNMGFKKWASAAKRNIRNSVWSLRKSKRWDRQEQSCKYTHSTLYWILWEIRSQWRLNSRGLWGQISCFWEWDFFLRVRPIHACFIYVLGGCGWRMQGDPKEPCALKLLRQVRIRHISLAAMFVERDFFTEPMNWSRSCTLNTN